MKHPLFSSKTIFGFYILAWVLLFSIQTLAFFQLFDVSWFFALIDNLIFGSIFFLIGLGSWYFVRFNKFEKNQILPLFLEHLASAFVLVSIWVFSGTYILGLIFSTSADYLNLIWGVIGWRYGIGFLLYLVMVVVFYLHTNNQNQQKRLEMETNLRANLQNTEIDLLRSKLNPHFLFNSLNSLNALIQTDTEKASAMLIQLADFLRFSLEKDKQDEIYLKDEFINLDRYIAIEQVRYGERLKYSKEIDEKAIQLKLPAMLLQPLTENAIKYSIGSKLDEVEVSISAYKKNNFLVIEIVNAFDKTAAVSKGSGNGIENVRKRLDMIYKKTADFRIENNGNVFKVIIEIPQTD